MDAVERSAEIHGARAERIFRPTLHESRQVGPAPEHLRRWGPVRPRLLGDDRGDARPGETDAADADAVFERSAIVLDKIEAALRRVHDDRAGSVFAGGGNRLALDRARIGHAAKEFVSPTGRLPAGITAVRVVHVLRLRRKAQSEQGTDYRGSRDGAAVHPKPSSF